ncbi:protocadherin alpha-7-like [Nematolebias whitei]|uniref:protocadherin alpha-7-like n=1 Tax=Nematolebias whitei TaxID=451745 RepID=UPI00189BC42F|nr:protocadherin alpha-7-like [Nematolebias whitei]
MGAGGQSRGMRSWWLALSFSVMLSCVDPSSAQIKYSIPEEVKVGSVVGNIAKDLGLDVNTLEERKFRIVSGSKEAQFEVSQNNGVLYVHRNIDREQVCENVSPCLINLKLVAENPMEIHYIGVEIIDINDNSPSFQEEEKILEISESVLPGRRFQLPNAHDPDVSLNTVRVYKLNQNDFFSLQIRESGEVKVPLLVLQKALDREKDNEHKLTLTALDGGNPPKSGTLNVTVTVLDSNDNHPVFSQDIYSVSISENVKNNTSVITVNATDLDEGVNGETEYVFGNELNADLYNIFSLNKVSGEIRTKGNIDFERTDIYKLEVHANDKGHPPMGADCTIIIKVLDENDNEPEIEVTSLSKLVSEDSKPGTVVSLISVKDQDSGLNGKVICSLSNNVPFDLKPSFQDNMYSLVLKQRLDRESVSHYDITITASDCGQPPLSTSRTLSIDVSDVNDNAPEFLHNPIELYLIENNVPGNPICSVSALDKDLAENAALSYHLVREESRQMKTTAFLNINSENGQITALKSFDFENLKTFQFQVVATDSGALSLSNNVTVNVFILDQNDNTMGAGGQSGGLRSWWLALSFSVMLSLVDPSLAQIKYSIPEEVKVGSVVGNIAKDLGLDISSLLERQFRIVAGAEDVPFTVNPNNGVLFVQETIDREKTCESVSPCLINLKLVAENPMEIHYVGVEVIDVNDHSPSFQEEEKTLEIYESTPPGKRFQLPTARDPDVAVNTRKHVFLN